MNTTDIHVQKRYGLPLCNEMLETFDFSSITWTITRYNKQMTSQEANDSLNAFIQWFALIPASDVGQWYVMLQTPIEEAFHAFVLNTHLYQQFCARYLGYFFHHNPVRDETESEALEGTRYTVKLLESHYGSDLHPLLKDWRRQMENGTAKVACVGKGGRCN